MDIFVRTIPNPENHVRIYNKKDSVTSERQGTWKEITRKSTIHCVRNSMSGAPAA